MVASLYQSVLYKKDASGTNPNSAIGSCSLVVCVGVDGRVPVGEVSVGLSEVARDDVAVGVGWWTGMWNVVTGTM